MENGPENIINDSDRELELALWLENADSGDIYILEILTKHYAPEIYRLFLALLDTGENNGKLHEQAFAKTEKVFQHAAQNLDSFQGYESVRSWLITLAINIFNSNRKLKFPPSSRDQKINHEIFIKQADKNLSGQYKTIIELYKEDNPFSQTAIILRFAHRLPVNRIAQILKIRIPEIINVIEIFRSHVEDALVSAKFFARPAEKVHQKFLPLIELSLVGSLSDDHVGSNQLSQHLLTCTSCRMYLQHYTRIEVGISKAFENEWPEEAFSAVDQKKILDNLISYPQKKERLISISNTNMESLILGFLLIVVLAFGYFVTKKELPKANPLIYPTLTIKPTSFFTPLPSQEENREKGNTLFPTPTVLNNLGSFRNINGFVSSTHINRKFVYYREPTLSPNGDFLVFSVSFTNITIDGPRFENGLYILNLTDYTIEPPIIFQENSLTDIWSFTPSISANGRYITFQNIAQGLSPKELDICVERSDPLSCTDVYLYDRVTGSMDLPGLQTHINNNNGSRILPSISGDGNWISFWSSPGDDENLYSKCGERTEVYRCWNIDLINLGTGERTILPVGRVTTKYRTNNFERLSLSNNGDLLGFTLHNDDALAASLGTKNLKEAIIYERNNGTFQAVNQSNPGSAGNVLSTHAILSADGRYAAFASNEIKFKTEENNQYTNIFLRDLKTGKIKRISVSSIGGEADGESGVYLHPNEPWKDIISISPDGRYIAFLSSAENLDPGLPAECPDNSWFPCTNVFIHDVQTSQTEMISTETHRRDRIFLQPSLSANGEKVAYILSDVDCFQAPSCTSILLYDNENKTTRSISDFGFNTLRTQINRNDLTIIRDDTMSGVTALEFSPDDSLLASASNDKTVRIWNVYGNSLQTYHNEHEQLISDISFSNDGKFLASGSHDGTIVIWNLETEKIKNLYTGPNSIFALDFSPDGEKLAAGGSNKFWIWDIDRNPPILLTSKEYPDVRFNSLVYSPDGDIIALGTSDNSIWIIDTNSGDIVSRLGGHEGDITVVDFSPDGIYLASGSTDSTGKVWKRSNKGIEFEALISIQFDDWINDIAFTPDGNRIAISSFGNEITIWELPSGNKADIPLGSRWFQPLSIAFSSQTSRNKLAVGSSSGGIEIFSIPVLRKN